MRKRESGKDAMPRAARAIAIGAAALVAAMSAACGPTAHEGLDASRLPESTRADYAVFELRCSKCHSIQRPLNMQHYDDAQWAKTVARMRQKPESAIGETDAAAILRFLRYYAQRSTGVAAPATD